MVANSDAPPFRGSRTPGTTMAATRTPAASPPPGSRMVPVTDPPETSCAALHTRIAADTLRTVMAEFQAATVRADLDRQPQARLQVQERHPVPEPLRQRLRHRGHRDRRLQHRRVRAMQTPPVVRLIPLLRLRPRVPG